MSISRKVIYSVLIISLLFLVVGCHKKQTGYTYAGNEIEELKENYNNTSKVISLHVTEGGIICYDVTEYKDDIYNSLINMKILGETEEVATDNGLYYEFYLNNGEKLAYGFNAGHYEKDNKYYVIEKPSFKISYDKEVDCGIWKKK